MGIFVSFSIKTLFCGINFSWDDLEYHAPIVAHWLSNKNLLSVAPFTYQSYYPFNTEMLSLWYMLPFNGDSMVSLGSFYWVVLIAAAIVALNLAQRNSNFNFISTGILSATLLLVSPVTFQSADLFSPNELAGTGMILSAIALLMPSSKNNTTSSRLVDVAYCGLLFGFAVGCKVSFIPALLVTFLWLIFRSKQVYGKNTREITVFTVCAAVTGTYWYIKNIFLTGNPFFPAEIGPFNGPFGVKEQYNTKLISWILRPLKLQELKYLIKSYTNWPFCLALLALSGYVFTLNSYLRKKKSIDKREPNPSFLLLITGLSLLFVFPFTPFSGTCHDNRTNLVIFLRYIFPSFSIGIVLFSTLINNGNPQKTFWRAISILVIVLAWPSRGSIFENNVNAVLNQKNFFISNNLILVIFDNISVLTDIVILVAVLIILCLYRRYKDFIYSRWIEWKIFAVFSLIPLIFLIVWEPYKQLLTDASIYYYGTNNKEYFGDAWHKIEKLIPDGASITWFGVAPGKRCYPLFGRKLQFTPVPVNYDGSIREPIHEVYKNKNKNKKSHPEWWRYTIWGLKDDKPDLNNLITNLVNARVDYIFITKWWNYGKWPKQYEFLISSKRTRLIYSEEQYAIFKLPRNRAWF